MKDNSSDRQPRTTTVRGFTKAKYLTDEQIEQILDEIAAGSPIEEACRAAGTSSSQFTRRCNREPELKERLRIAGEEGVPQHQEFLRYMIHQQIRAGNTKVLLAAASIHLPEYEALRTQRFEHTVTHQDAITAAVLKALDTQGMSLDDLDRKIAELEALPVDQHPVLELPARAVA